MGKIKQDINIRSDEVQDIMSQIPGRLVRSGLSAMFILTLSGIFFSWFIKYPEIITGKIILTTKVEPLKLVSQSSGIIKQLCVIDGEVVKEGTLLAEIENPLSAASVYYLHNYLNKLEKSIANSETELPLPDTSIGALGDLQSVVTGLMKELLAYNITSSYRMDDVEMKSIKNKIENQKELITVNDKIITIAVKDLEGAKIKFDAEEKLFQEAVIAKMDFIQLESAYRAKELNLEHLKEAGIDLKNALNALELQYKQTEFNKYNKGKNNLEAIRGYMKSIKSFVYGWQQKYSLTATEAGKVIFLERMQVGTFLKGGEQLFAIIQPKGSYLGIATVPAGGYGKVKVGQEAHILLQNYPYYDFGMLQGKVENVALFPNTNEYRVEISLPNGMVTTQKEVLRFTPEMVGEAEIVTADKRLIERIFNSVTKAIKRK